MASIEKIIQGYFNTAKTAWSKGKMLADLHDSILNHGLTSTDQINSIFYIVYKITNNISETVSYTHEIGIRIKSPSGVRKVTAADVTHIIDYNDIKNKNLQGTVRRSYNEKRGYDSDWNTSFEKVRQTEKENMQNGYVYHEVCPVTPCWSKFYIED